MGAKKLNTVGSSYAASLISAGKISDDKSWSGPTIAASELCIKERTIGEFGKHFLAFDPDIDTDQKAHFEFPISADFDKVSIRGLKSVITRSAKAGLKEVCAEAETLYRAAKKKLGRKEPEASAVTKICARKASERMLRDGTLTKASEAEGYTASDLMRWVQEECCEMEFGEDGCCYAYPVNFVMPAHEKGETWQVIVCARGCLYCVDFKLGDAGVEIVGEPKPVVQKDLYVVLDSIVEEASDEAAGRSGKEDRSKRLQPGRMYRSFDVEEDANEDTLEIPVSFASELPGLQRCGGYDGRGAPTECERSGGIKSGEVYIEILDGDPANIDHSVLNNRGAVLDEHDEKDQIGVVKEGSSRTDKGTRVSRARLKMDDGEKGRMRFRQMRNGIRPHLSAGYKHTKHLGKETLPDGRTAHRFAWSGMEISSVAVPLDGTIGVGRSYKELPTVDSDYKNKSSDQTPETKEKSMTEAEIKAAEEAKIKAAEDRARTETETRVRKEMEEKARAELAARETAVTASVGTDERKRFTDISKIRDGLIEKREDQAKEIRALADKALTDGTSAKDFSLRAMEDILNAKPAVQNTMETLGLKGEIYDLTKAVQNVIIRADGGRKQGIFAPDEDTVEGQAHIRIRKAMEKAGGGHPDRDKGFLVPADALISSRKIDRSQLRDMMKRDATMQSTIFGQGGASVQTDIMLPIVEILRNEMITAALGVTPLTGLEGNIAIPRQTAASTAYALGETAALTLSGQLLDQIVLSPHKVGAYNAYSRQLLLQSSMDLESFMRTDMFAVIAIAWDEYILNGQGGADQPTGILNQNGVLLVNGNGQFTGYPGDANAPAWADIVNFETQIAKVNARRQGRAWATTSNSKGRLKTLARLLVGATTVPSVALWEGNMGGGMEGMMNGYPAIDSQQIPNDVLMFGVWAQNVIHALWGGLNIIVDPYTGAANSVVKIYMDTFGDVAIRHPQEFCISLNPASA
jgi:HK97 family phage major capsid protein